MAARIFAPRKCGSTTRTRGDWPERSSHQRRYGRREKVVLTGSSESLPSSGTGVAVSGVMLVIFLFAIDGTIVSAAMPTIAGKLGGLELYSWVFSTYMLTSALASLGWTAGRFIGGASMN